MIIKSNFPKAFCFYQIYTDAIILHFTIVPGFESVKPLDALRRMMHDRGLWGENSFSCPASMPEKIVSNTGDRRSCGLFLGMLF